MSLYKYTDNNNVFNLSDITGLIGKTGFKGPIGLKGITGDQGIQGPKGADNFVKTDISFSGVGNPYRIVTSTECAGIPVAIGHCIISNPKDITSAKVLIGGWTNNNIAQVEFYLANLTVNDSDGNDMVAQIPIVGQQAAFISDAGFESNMKVIDLTMSNSLFPAVESILELRALIFPQLVANSPISYLYVSHLSLS